MGYLQISNSVNLNGLDTADGYTAIEFIKELKECSNHELKFGLTSNGARKYRRGKNRCLRCGSKK